jgi:nucleotide-binding universal stress UspA family protein
VITPTPFASILCGIEGDPASDEALRQAITLARGAELHLVSVSPIRRIRRRSNEELQQSLEEATRLALDSGVSVSARLVRSPSASKFLLPESEKHDLLVLGGRDRSRRAGIALDSTASRAAHETRVPLLIAREPAGRARFPEEILLASDGLPGSWAPARTAAVIASSFDARLEVVHVAERAHPERGRAVEAQVAEIGDVLGRSPPLAETAGHPTHAIVDQARERSSTLLVCGRRGLHGIRALGSVSERVVHRAPCSVLLVPALGAEEIRAGAPPM